MIVGVPETGLDVHRMIPETRRMCSGMSREIFEESKVSPVFPERLSAHQKCICARLERLLKRLERPCFIRG
jgi:hypothetical protein